MDQHFNDRERGLFNKVHTACPAHEPGKCAATMDGKCSTPEACPVMFWLKATGLLKLGVYEITLPKTPEPHLVGDTGKVPPALRQG